VLGHYLDDRRDNMPDDPVCISAVFRFVAMPAARFPPRPGYWMLDLLHNQNVNSRYTCTSTPFQAETCKEYLPSFCAEWHQIFHRAVRRAESPNPAVQSTLSLVEGVGARVLVDDAGPCDWMRRQMRMR
jgi:hypothetical protein